MYQHFQPNEQTENAFMAQARQMRLTDSRDASLSIGGYVDASGLAARASHGMQGSLDSAKVNDYAQTLQRERIIT